MQLILENVYHNCEKWILERLVERLSRHVYAREPAAVAGVRMVPANNILHSPNLGYYLLHVSNQVFLPAKIYLDTQPCTRSYAVS
jgi:hypothetical protein